MYASNHVIVAVLIGWVLVLILGYYGVKWSKKYISQDLNPPSEALSHQWHRLTKDTDRPGALLGALERTLFYTAFWISAHGIIAAWFAFKVASKWEALSNIGRLPEKLESVDQLDYAISRRQLASHKLMSFLVGTLINLLIALGCYLFVECFLISLVAKWCLS